MAERINPLRHHHLSWRANLVMVARTVTSWDSSSSSTTQVLATFEGRPRQRAARIAGSMDQRDVRKRLWIQSGHSGAYINVPDHSLK
jgi:hypothetical protein